MTQKQKNFEKRREEFIKRVNPILKELELALVAEIEYTPQGIKPLLVLKDLKK